MVVWSQPLPFSLVRLGLEFAGLLLSPPSSSTLLHSLMHFDGCGPLIVQELLNFEFRAVSLSFSRESNWFRHSKVCCCLHPVLGLPFHPSPPSLNPFTPLFLSLFPPSEYSPFLRSFRWFAPSTVLLSELSFGESFPSQFDGARTSGVCSSSPLFFLYLLLSSLP